MKQLLACCFALGLCVLAPNAFADDSAVPIAPQGRDSSAQVERRWYGWQTLTSDAASAGLMLGGLQAAEGYNLLGGAPLGAKALFTAGLAGYVAGGPAIHFIHKRPAAAAGSIALRLVLPILGGLLGNSLATCPPPTGDWGNCGSREIFLGLGAGTLAAVAIDAGALSWAPVEKEPSAAPRLGFAPIVSSDGKRGEVRVFGTF